MNRHRVTLSSCTVECTFVRRKSWIRLYYINITISLQHNGRSFALEITSKAYRAVITLFIVATTSPRLACLLTVTLRASSSNRLYTIDEQRPLRLDSMAAKVYPADRLPLTRSFFLH